MVTFSCEPWSACLLCLLFWGTINEEIYGKGYYYHQNGGDTLINYSTRYLSVRFLFGWIILSCILYLVFFQVIIVMPTNPSTGTGWKKGADIPCKKDLVQCIEKNAYLEHEVLVNVENHVQVTDFFHDIQNAMWKLLKFDPGIITYKLGSPTVSIPASSIQLNATLIYYLAFLDPSLQFWADSPDIFPRSFQRLKENTNYLVNMKVHTILYLALLSLT